MHKTLAREKKEKNLTGTSDEAVKAKTGKEWEEWVKLLDKEKAYHLPHNEIAILLEKKFGITPWWCQSVTVGYERAKGLRAINERPDGFSTSVSKTFTVPVSKLFNSWTNEKLRKKWMSQKIILQKVTEDKALRITWEDGNKAVSAEFYPKAADKTQLTVQHGKLKDAKAVAIAKKFWKEALAKLESTQPGQ